MSELLDKQVVLDTIFDKMEKVENADTVLGMAVAMGVVKELPPVEQKQAWIPVSERLPEKNDVYLVAINSYGCPTRDVDGFSSQSVRKWEMYGKSVVAWMPLPEPYKASPTGAEGSDKE